MDVNEALRLRISVPRANDRGAACPMILDAIASEPSFAPSEMGPDECVRRRFDREEALGHVAAGNGAMLYFWSHSAELEVFGRIPCWPFVPETITLELHVRDPRALATVFAAASRLAERLEVAYGSLQREQTPAFRRAHGRLEGSDYCVTQIALGGLPAPGERTWFGPALVRQLDPGVLSQLGRPRPMTHGGVEMDLRTSPWTLSAEELAQARLAAREILCARGLHSAPNRHGTIVRGARWKRLPWGPIDTRREVDVVEVSSEDGAGT